MEYEKPADPLLAVQVNLQVLDEARSALRNARSDFERAQRLYEKSREDLSDWLKKQDEASLAFRELVGI